MTDWLVEVEAWQAAKRAEGSDPDTLPFPADLAAKIDAFSRTPEAGRMIISREITDRPADDQPGGTMAARRSSRGSPKPGARGS